jgi:hypothetical protein
MKRTLIVVLVAAGVLLGTAVVLKATAPESGKAPSSTALSKPSGTPTSTMLNINRIASWFSANGEQERRPLDGNSGLYYPRGTSTAIYSAGLMYGGIFRDGKTPEIRANGNSYQNGFKPGKILGIRTGEAEDPNAPDVRIWRIRRDYPSVDLRQDAAELNYIGLNAVTDAQVAAVRAQYETDWREWPAQKGAPFYDANNDGVYTPQFTGEVINGVQVPVLYPLADEPGVATGDQVIWYVANDIGVSQPWSCPESGIEMQVTIWGYARTDPVGETLFKKFRVIYKGTRDTPLDGRIEDMYLCQWSDPDLGEAGDDFAGCDTLLSMNYVYNANASDANYAAFGLVPPASGYDFLQGPLVLGNAGEDRNRNGVDDAADFAIWNLQRKGPGYINLPMTSAIYFAAGGTYSDPPFSYNGAVQWYQMLRGLPPTPQGPPDPPMILNPVTGQRTPYWLSGDPVTGTGWNDGIIDNQGDRRILMNSGPFTMAVGDTQELVCAWVGGIGSSRLNSVQIMKFNDKFVQTAYDSLFRLPGPPANPKLEYYTIDNQILLDWGADSAAVAKVESTVVIGNYVFEGYKVYQYPDATGDPSKAILVAKYDLVNGVKTIRQPSLDPISGELEVLPAQYGTDNGIQYTLLLSTDQVTGREFVPGQRYYFAVTAYNYTPVAENPFKTYESVPAVITIIPESPKPGTRYPYSFEQEVQPTSEIGGSDADAVMVIDNPTKQVGDLYTILFDTATGGTVTYDIFNSTKGQTLFTDQTDLTGTVPYVDRDGGLRFLVSGPPAGLVSLTDQNGQNAYGLNSPDPAYGVLNVSGNINNLGGTGRTNRDYEVRFDGVGSYASTRVGIQIRVHWVPFTAWDLGRSSADTPRQVSIGVIDTGQTGTVWTFKPNGLVQGGKNRAVFEEFSVVDLTYPGDSLGVYAARNAIISAAASQSNALNAIYLANIWDKQRTGTYPPVGTRYKFVKYHEIRPGDGYTFQTGAVVVGDQELAKEDVNAIKAFPNPYYGVNASETTRESKYITFNHLPAGRTVFRIYNLAGTLVRKLEKNSADQFFTWDLLNHNNLPVASGIYIVYLDMVDLGVQKTLKVAIIQEEQILQRY